MNVEECIHIMGQRFPEKHVLAKYCINEREMVDLKKFTYWEIGYPLMLLLEWGTSPEETQEYLDFLELMYIEGDNAVKLLMYISVVSHIIYDKTISPKFYELASDKLKELIIEFRNI